MVARFGKRGTRAEGTDFTCSDPLTDVIRNIRKLMAEREGFEPPVAFRPQQFSRLPVSTAHAPLRLFHSYYSIVLNGRAH